jgi:uncharacterized protein YndB with AHSA1/START domain
MIVKDSVVIEADPTVVWQVFTDVERWPEWTASVSEVRFVQGSTVEVGARVRIKQPRLPVVAWRVTELEPGTSWSWVAGGPGVRTVARHTVTATGDGSTLVEQSIEQRGALGRFIGHLLRRLTERYVAMEGAGLKRRCEQPITV